MNSQGRCFCLRSNGAASLPCSPCVMIFGQTTSAMAATPMEQEQLVDKAKMTMEAFAADPLKRRGARVEGCQRPLHCPAASTGRFHIRRRRRQRCAPCP